LIASAGMPERIAVEVREHESVTAMLYPAAPPQFPDVTLILGHGAGAGQTSGFMVRFAAGLAMRGLNLVTFNFPYMERGRRIPDRNETLEACWRAVIATAGRHAALHGNRTVIGGKSMGGRIATQVAAAGADVAGVVLLGYPLHPPGKPDRLRSVHLASVKAPMLFVQVSLDAFGTPDKLRPIIEALPAPTALHVVNGGDHSFKVLKRTGIRQPEVEADVMDRIAAWVRDALKASRGCGLQDALRS
jgi:uncharacterized protein